MSKKAILFGKSKDVLSLLLSSQLGIGADATHTLYNKPWFRVKFGAGHLAGDTVQLIINGIDNSSAVLAAVNLNVGYIDIQVNAILAAGSPTAAICFIRSAVRGPITASITVTIFGAALDGMASSLYAAHGLQLLLSSYAGALCQITRTNDNATLDLFPGPDGYINGSQALSFIRGQGNFGSPRVHVSILYDQTGNARHATPASIATAPFVWTRANTIAGGAPFNTWGWRAQLYFDETATDKLNVTNMGAYAQNIGAGTIVGMFGTTSFNAGHVKAAVSINGGTGHRMALICGDGGPNNFRERAGGRRLDADTEAFSSYLGPTSLDVNFHLAAGRFDFTNAVLTFDDYETTTSLNPFQTAGTTSNTTSDTTVIGADASGNFLSGCLMAIAWFQRKLSDTEIATLRGSSQFNYPAIPNRTLVRAGTTLGIEPFRTAITQEIFKGTPFFGVLPTAGFDTNNLNTTDPLAGIGFSPVNLLQFDNHTITATNGVLSNIGVWKPTSGTTNGKWIVYVCGTEGYPPTAAFNDALLVKTMVEAGYTFCYVSGVAYGPSLPDPTGSLNPTRYNLESPIRTINALQGSFTTPPLGLGFSAGCSVATLLTGIDTRINASVPYDYNIPIYGEKDSSAERMLLGMVGLPATSGCDWPDIWVLGITGGTNSKPRTLALAYSDSETFNSNGCQNFFQQARNVATLYPPGVFSTHFDLVDTSHQWGTSTIAYALSIFANY